MEEGEMKGICAAETRKGTEKIRREWEVEEKRKNSIRYKVLRRFRRDEERRPEC